MASASSGGKYTVSGLPQCNGQAIDQCSGLATGCPVPWPTVEQFQQWGTYLSNQKTVTHHLSAVYETLGVRGRSEATAWAFRAGVVE